MEKVRVNLSINKDAYDYLRALAGSERKVGETVSSLIVDAKERSGMTEAGICAEIARLMQKLSEIKAQ